MANFNKVILAGNLTRDPQLSNLPSGMAVCEFGIAVNRKWRPKEGGDMREEVCYVDLRAYGRTAETISQYMQKGKPLLVEGRLKYDQWEAKDGGKRSKLYVVVDNFQFLGAPGGGDRSGGGGGRGDYGDNRPARNDRGGGRPAPAAASYDGGGDEMPPMDGGGGGDEVPF